MRPLMNAQRTNANVSANEVIEALGDESIISDVRSRISPADIVEQKFQNALRSYSSANRSKPRNSAAW